MAEKVAGCVEDGPYVVDVAHDILYLIPKSRLEDWNSFDWDGVDWDDIPDGNLPEGLCWAQPIGNPFDGEGLDVEFGSYTIK